MGCGSIGRSGLDRGEGDSDADSLEVATSESKSEVLYSSSSCMAVLEASRPIAPGVTMCSVRASWLGTNAALSTRPNRERFTFEKRRENLRRRAGAGGGSRRIEKYLNF